MLTIIKTECYEDEDYTYEKEWLSDGGININRHPKNPEIPKEKLLNEIIAPMLIEAWRRRERKNAKEA